MFNTYILEITKCSYLFVSTYCIELFTTTYASTWV